MSVQPSIASFFGKRKRIVTEDVYKSKHIKTEHFSDNSGKTEQRECEAFEPKFNNFNEVKKSHNQELKLKSLRTPEKIGKKKSSKQLDIRESLKKWQERQSVPEASPVKFHLLGSLSPVKKAHKNKTNISNFDNSLSKGNINASEFSNSSSTGSSSIRNLHFSEKTECPTEDIIKSAQEFVNKIKETQKKLTVEGPKSNGLSLKGVKDKITKSSKLVELKKSINKINQHAEELIELEKRKLIGTQPKLTKFTSFNIEVPISPQKKSLYSPSKQQKSPIKPAYERFSSLVDTTTSLPLPFCYQKLYELFCAADTICSMITNRGEILTFSKLKPAVEEMTRKTFTTRHLGQIATVYPGAFSFRQEKIKNFGSTSKADKYELVITPIIPQNLGDGSSSKTTLKDDDVFILAEKRSMTPKVIKVRKEIFYQNLLDRTKDFHQEFLKTLDPPLLISKNDLKRWHPNFLIDFVPDVNPQELPQPPDTEKPATAKEILDRARNFLNSNVRLQKALESASVNNDDNVTSNDCKINPEVKSKIDARSTSLLKGIPKALLEKVRAKQAAKALDAMRMTSEERKETIMYSRLPEIARIIRTAFVNEQKGVLLLELLAERVQFSYNRSLSLSEVENHIRLLCELLPEWLSVVLLRNLNFVKVNRNVNVTSVMIKLNKLVEEKTKEKLL